MAGLVRLTRALTPAVLMLSACLSPVPVRAVDVLHEVRFPVGRQEMALRGAVQGSTGARYRLQGAAGQTLAVSLAASHGSPEFNVRAEGAGEAMYMSDVAGPQARLILPDDGRYLVTVYLMRSGARRGERAAYALNLSLAGTPLPALAAAQDALVPGTRFHASARVNCLPPYATAETSCQAGVVRRGRDGSASVEIRGPQALLRRLLFVRGETVSSDTAQPMRQRREGDTHVIVIGESETYRIPDALLTGG